jgi:hypothetical protein
VRKTGCLPLQSGEGEKNSLLFSGFGDTFDSNIFVAIEFGGMGEFSTSFVSVTRPI